MKVLVVDDEPAVRQALRHFLALERYEVELASDGGETLRWQAASTPDAVVLDVLMPEVDGAGGLQTSAPNRRGHARAHAHGA